MSVTGAHSERNRCSTQTKYSEGCSVLQKFRFPPADKYGADAFPRCDFVDGCLFSQYFDYDAAFEFGGVMIPFIHAPIITYATVFCVSLLGSIIDIRKNTHIIIEQSFQSLSMFRVIHLLYIPNLCNCLHSAQYYKQYPLFYGFPLWERLLKQIYC